MRVWVKIQPIKQSHVFPKTFIFQATIKQYQTAENIDFAWVFFSLHFQICTVFKEQDMYTELKQSATATGDLPRTPNKETIQKKKKQ